ncbi:hypothetical protein [Flavobacterium sp.]|uniref:hypothetical protein n=1 Tax=Flavobacterium sp. TaxID=239 RepID=UPI002639199D|nr:hypothetical protein [Flavobacterium sp.]
MENKLLNVLAVLVNYGNEQLSYLEQVVQELKRFEKYNVTVIVNSNIPLDIPGIDKINVYELDDYQLLPLTCRRIIWENKDNFELFLYGENDHLFIEEHLDNHLLYSKILPKNRISGLIQIEKDGEDIYYPGYHSGKGYVFEWDFQKVETYQGKKFAYFSNLHQATFILTKDQLLRVGKKIDFNELVDETENEIWLNLKRRLRRYFGIQFKNKAHLYSLKCKVNTDIYKYSGFKKLICISDFEENLIHHLPNIYIDGKAGRKKLRSDSERMDNALKRLLKK